MPTARKTACPDAGNSEGDSRAIGIHRRVGPDGRERYEALTVRRLFQLHHMMMRVGDRMTEPLGLTASRWMMICIVGRENEARTISDISDEIKLSTQNVSRMLASLESEGLVRRERTGGRGRAVYVELTERGRDAYAQTHALAERFVAEFLKDLDADRVARIETDLGVLIENTASFEDRLLEDENQRKESADA